MAIAESQQLYQQDRQILTGRCTLLLPPRAGGTRGSGALGKGS